MAHDYVNMISMNPVTSVSGDTDVTIYRGVPWDNTYKHVRLFDSRVALDTYLETLEKIKITQCAPVRFENQLRVALPQNDMAGFQYNYIRFINNESTNIPHYGFITGVEWQSLNSCILTFELDIWTECEFSFVVRRCFVERMHVPVANDIPGNYTFPEGLETGEYVSRGSGSQIPPTSIQRKRSLVFATTFNQDFGTTPVGIYDGIYNGLSYISFELDGSLGQINAWLNQVFSKNLIDGIVNAYIIPTYYTDGKYKTDSITITKPYTTIDTYTPRNKKCFVYPYNYMIMTNNTGNVVELHYEDFIENDSYVEIEYTCTGTADATLIAYPVDHKRIDKDYDSAITFSNYTKIPIATNTFQAWLAQNSALLNANAYNTGINAVGTMVNGSINALIGTAGGNVLAPAQILTSGLSAAQNVATTAINQIATVESHKMTAPGSVGVQSNAMSTMINSDKITVYRVECKREYIKKIDDIFWAYGYKICELELPLINSRRYWNYVKTVDCNFTGKMPLNMLAAFRQIFDNGVTIWHTNDIGNYTLNNNAIV